MNKANFSNTNSTIRATRLSEVYFMSEEAWIDLGSESSAMATRVMGGDDSTLTVYVHGGRHHVDEVVAVALLSLLGRRLDVHEVDRAELSRGFNPPTGLVIDCGREFDPARGRFDHHELDLVHGGIKDVDGTQLKYSAAGLVWRYFSAPIVHRLAAVNGVPASLRSLKSIAERVQAVLLNAVDAQDNGQLLTPNDGKAPELSVRGLLTSICSASEVGMKFTDMVAVARAMLGGYLVSQVKGAPTMDRIVDTFAKAVDSGSRVVFLEPGDDRHYKSALATDPELYARAEGVVQYVAILGSCTVSAFRRKRGGVNCDFSSIRVDASKVRFRTPGSICFKNGEDALEFLKSV